MQFILKSAAIPKVFLLFFCMVGPAVDAVQNTVNFLIPTSAGPSCLIKEAAVAAMLRIFYSKMTHHI